VVAGEESRAASQPAALEDPPFFGVDPLANLDLDLKAIANLDLDLEVLERVLAKIEAKRLGSRNSFGADHPGRSQIRT
jgi:hypothetical protein